MEDYNNISSYTVEDIAKALRIEYELCTQNKLPELNPKAYILGGQGGSGKSTLQEMFIEFNSNTICINGDEYRKYHPRFKEIQSVYGNEAANYTQSFANAVANALVEELSFEGYNVVIEGTCRRADIPLKTCKDLKEKGYEVELSVMCTDHKTAWQSTIDRYNKMLAEGDIPRAVPRDKYEETVKALPDNIETLYLTKEFDEITLYNRNRECLYRMTEQPKNSPKDILYKELHSSDLASVPLIDLTDEDEQGISR